MNYLGIYLILNQLKHVVFNTYVFQIVPAYRLADAGYDVWLANARGTKYSQDNINYSVDDNEYWDFG